MIDPVGRANLARIGKLKWIGELEKTVPGRGADSVQISEMARLLDRLRKLPELRMDKIHAAQRAILEGSYLTPARLDAAVRGAGEEGDL